MPRLRVKQCFGRTNTRAVPSDMIGKCGLVKCACGRLTDKTDTDLSRGNTPVPTTQVLPFPSYLHIDVLITAKLLYANIVLFKFTATSYLVTTRFT